MEKEEVIGMFPLMKWTPTMEVSSLRRDMDELVERLFGHTEKWPFGPGLGRMEYPAMDVTREDDNFIVRLELPGIDPKDVDVTITGNLLTVKGDRKEEKKVDEEDCYLREITAGHFERSLTLPVDINADMIKATYTDGMLEIRLPAEKAVKGRKVEIAVGHNHKKEIEGEKKMKAA